MQESPFPGAIRFPFPDGFIKLFFLIFQGIVNAQAIFQRGEKILVRTNHHDRIIQFQGIIHGSHVKRTEPRTPIHPGIQQPISGIAQRLAPILLHLPDSHGFQGRKAVHADHAADAGIFRRGFQQHGRTKSLPHGSHGRQSALLPGYGVQKRRYIRIFP